MLSTLKQIVPNKEEESSQNETSVAESGGKQLSFSNAFLQYRRRKKFKKEIYV